MVLGVQERISTKMAMLSPQLQRAAQFVSENPEGVATRSLRYVAKLTGVSPPTFTRLASALGYEKYEGLRESCRDQIMKQGLIFAAKAKALQEQGPQEEREGLFVVRQAKSAISNINQLLKSVDPEQIEVAAKNLASARKVILVGMMSSLPFIEYMAYVASMGYENWHVLGRDSQSDTSLINGIGQADVALVISKAPYALRAIKAAEQIQNRGTFVIGITDKMSSPLCQHCDSIFFVSTETPQFFTSHAATLVLIESLVGLVVSYSDDSVNQRIASVEATGHKIGDYFPKS